MDSNSITPASSGKQWMSWTVSAVALASALGIYVKVAVPAQQDRAALTRDKQALESELTETKQAAQKQKEQIETLLRDKDNLSQEHTEAQVQLEQALKEKQEALDALEKAKRDLSDTLGTQIAAGDVLIREQNGELVLDVADHLLFNTGKAEVNEPGTTFLLEVAKSMKRLGPKQVFRVGGHTDYLRVVSKDIAAQYPTNWELSTARATNVVRFLQEKGKVPGRQLIAAGFSQYRPAATNKTEAGRKRNRRIEIVLLRKRR